MMAHFSGTAHGKEVREMAEERMGIIATYFAKVGVAGVQIQEGTLNVGDSIHIKGYTTDFIQTVESMQLENQPIDKALAGQLVGLKVVERVREKDEVFKVTG